MILIQPTAPMPNFGIIGQDAHGHIVTTILIAMVAMLFTAVSYGRMARAYPSAGSVFTYVGCEINPTLGFLAGWGYMLSLLLARWWESSGAANPRAHLACDSLCRLGRDFSACCLPRSISAAFELARARTRGSSW